MDCVISNDKLTYLLFLKGPYSLPYTHDLNGNKWWIPETISG